MTNDRPEPLPNDELISAYHDGELSGDDLQRAESLLASDPASRQLLEELRTISASLNAAPRHRLGREFAQEVLHAAEESRSSPPAPADQGRRRTSRKGDEPSRDAIPWPKGRRPWIWAGAALAAALVLMFLVPDRGEHVQIARQEKPVQPPPASPERDFRDEGPATMSASDVDRDPRTNRSGAAGVSGLDGNANPLARSGTAGESAASPAAALAQPREMSPQLETKPLPPPLDKALKQPAAVATKSNLPGYLARGVLVVEIEINPAEDSDNLLARAYANNGIAFDRETGKSRWDSKAGDDAVVAEERNEEAAKSLASSSRSGAGKESGKDPSPELVYVVATESQLRGALDQLKASPEVTLRLLADPEVAWQTKYKAYNNPAAGNLAETSKSPTEKASDTGQADHEQRLDPVRNDLPSVPALRLREDAHEKVAESLALAKTVSPGRAQRLELPSSEISGLKQALNRRESQEALSSTAQSSAPRKSQEKLLDAKERPSSGTSSRSSSNEPPATISDVPGDSPAPEGQVSSSEALEQFAAKTLEEQQLNQPVYQQALFLIRVRAQQPESRGSSAPRPSAAPATKPIP